MRRLRILVCGTNYGRTYLEAIGLQPDSYELAGLLALGSERSAQLSARWAVPLYTDPRQLPGEIDIACAAIGRAGGDVVLRLLRLGIHVLCEHPQRSAWLETALQEAAAAGVRFHVNGHFGRLAAPEAFIERCRRQRGSEQPELVDIAATDRSLYGNLDILRSALGAFGPFRFADATHLGRFITVGGWVASLPATLHVQSSDPDQPDGSQRYLADLRITVVFPSGALSLLGIGGPVTWNANYGRCDRTGASLWCPVYEDAGISGAALYRQRILANLASIDTLARDAAEGIPPAEQAPEHILEVSRLWEAVSAHFSLL